ncbi:MAG: hypothetical protein PHG82_05155 [Candidatus Gracilibacteria bacterium]|nr:hypothetical protein [Candidatus Gracilibacteria bacterium]
MQIHIISQEGTSISHIPERGGLITSIKLAFEEILFLNEETLHNLEKNVRGGIPVMFPNAGPLRENSLYNLSQHGFARNKSWNSEKISDTKFMMFLESDSQTKEVFPFDFRIEIISEIISDKIVKITQKIVNTGSIDLPSRVGLHPYYFVRNDDKKDLKILLGEKLLEDYSFINGETVYLDNPGSIQVIFPDGKTLELNYDSSYKKLWIRSEIGKDFICIEPVYGDEDALLDNPLILKSGEEKNFEIIIKKS